MDLRHMGLASPKGAFIPITSKTTGEFLHRFRFEIEGSTYECPSNIISDYLIAEYELTVAAQLKDVVKDDLENEGMRDEINTRYVRSERNLYFKDSALPPATLDYMRSFSFKDSKWYRRSSLYNHCFVGGGCCSRGCGCCEKRADNVPLIGMSGHCTWACRCCMARKGLRFKDFDGDGFEKQYKDGLESDNPTLLLRMADCYFSKPTSQSLSNTESNSDSADNTQSAPHDEGANDDAKTMSKKEIYGGATNIISDPSPPLYKDVAEDDGERKRRRIWPWNRD